MTDKIYLIKNNEPITLEEKEYEQEKVLQELLGKYPDILAGEQMNPENPRRWILVTSELHLVSKRLWKYKFLFRSSFSRSRWCSYFS